jgi:hypothetical protein
MTYGTIQLGTLEKRYQQEFYETLLRDVPIRQLVERMFHSHSPHNVCIEYVHRGIFLSQKRRRDAFEDQAPVAKRRKPVAARPSNYKTVMCYNWQDGSCHRGNQCTYAHGVSELRVLAEL